MLVNLPWHEIIYATAQTIYMVFISGFFGVFFGLWVAVGLFLTRKKGLLEQPLCYHGLSLIVNLGRSIPYIILMIALIPLTRFLVGTSIGVNAAIVTLTIAAIPFYARVAETAFTEVSTGLIEAGLAMGANFWQILFHIILPESRIALVKGATLTLVGLIGYSAMAGAVGGGGLGELAIDYGYQRFDVGVMLVTVALLVCLVQLTQYIGDKLANSQSGKWALIFSVVLLTGLLLAPRLLTTDTRQETLKVGVMSGQQEKIMEVAKKVAWQEYHFHLDIVPFDDYVLPNTALNNGDIDANIFQHVPYLDEQIRTRHYAIMPLAKTFVYPMGFYSKKYQSIDQIPDGAKVALPNDPSNEARALLILQRDHLILLKGGVGANADVSDVLENPHHFDFVLMDAAQIPRALTDVALGALTNDYVAVAGFSVKDALLKEGSDSLYANVIVVRVSEAKNPLLQKLIKVIHSPLVVQATESAFPDGGAVEVKNG